MAAIASRTEDEGVWAGHHKLCAASRHVLGISLTLGRGIIHVLQGEFPSSRTTQVHEYGIQLGIEKRATAQAIAIV